MKKFNSITTILFIIISLISLVFCSCMTYAPYAKISQLTPAMDFQDVITSLGPPSRVVASESTVINKDIYYLDNVKLDRSIFLT